MYTLNTLPFDNHFQRLPDHFFSRLAPTPLEGAHLIHFNQPLAAELALDPAIVDDPQLVDQLTGALPLPGSAPLAMVYAGHQFGHLVPQLGDGRAILLGQIRDRAGISRDLHLKGAGITPYSRRGDGRAVLRSSIREYLCSEAMHALGIPTTRALVLIGSHEEVYRESIERGAMVMRVAESHLRFGHFEFFYYRQNYSALQTLLDYALTHYFPELREQPQPALALFSEVTARTARLIAAWQLVGFTHGVMNSDNMSLLGLTLDYGPYGFLDAWQPNFICNHSDHEGRYAFNRQPFIGKWNLSCLGQALLPLFADDPDQAAEAANSVLAEYDSHFSRHYRSGMQAKLGLLSDQAGDSALCHDLLQLLATSAVDYSNFLRDLADFDRQSGATNRKLRDQFIDRAAFDAWADRYRQRLKLEESDDVARRVRMNRTNPRYILRNYLAQIAIQRAEAGDYSEIDRLFAILSRPFDEDPAFAAYTQPPPDWGRHLEISCSS
jgi:serine/tyrosine/threonine adenylyltransferase